MKIYILILKLSLNSKFNGIIVIKMNLHNQNIHQLNNNQKIVDNKHLIHHILVDNSVRIMV